VFVWVADKCSGVSWCIHDVSRNHLTNHYPRQPNCQYELYIASCDCLILLDPNKKKTAVMVAILDITMSESDPTALHSAA